MNIFLFVTIFLIFSKSSVQVDIDCKCSDSGYVIVGTLYTCFVQNDLNIDSYENALVSSVKGTHTSGKTNDDVTGFQNNGTRFNFFPRNLDKYLKNLKAVWLPSANLKQINQIDLKPFPQLEFFGLPNNKIEVLEGGLFDYNTKLKGIWFYSNSINHIDATIFDKLTSLKTLRFNSNTCINSDASDDASKDKLITSVKSSCQDSNYLSINNKLKNLEDSNKNLNSQSMPTFIQGLESLNDEFKKSKFSYLTSMKLRLEKLNSTKNDDNCQDKKNSSSSLSEIDSRSMEGLSKFNDCCESISLKNLTNQIIYLEKIVQLIPNETLNVIKSIDCSHTEQFSSLDNTLLQLDKKVIALDEKFVEFDEKVSNFMAQESNKGNCCNNFDDTVTVFEENSNEFQTKTLQKFGNIEAEMMDSRFRVLKSIESKHQQLEKRIENLEKLLNKKLEKIMKALKVEE